MYNKNYLDWFRNSVSSQFSFLDNTTRPESQKTDCCCSIMSRNSGVAEDELPPPPCCGPTLISAGLFNKGERKEQRGQTDRNPFVSLRSDYLHGDEGPECSALFICESHTIEAVFVLSRDVWGAQERGEEEEEEEKGRSSAHCESHAHSLLLLWWVNCFPVPGFSVWQIMFPHAVMVPLDSGRGQVAWGTAESHKQVGVVMGSVYHITTDVLPERNWIVTMFRNTFLT